MEMERKVNVGDLVSDTWSHIPEGEQLLPYVVVERLDPPNTDVEWNPKHGKVIVADVSTGSTKVKWEMGLSVLSSSVGEVS